MVLRSWQTWSCSGATAWSFLPRPKLQELLEDTRRWGWNRSISGSSREEGVKDGNSPRIRKDGPVGGMVDGPPHSVWNPKRGDFESAACLPGELRLLHAGLDHRMSHRKLFLK